MEAFRLKRSNETTKSIHDSLRAKLMVPLDELCETLSLLKLQQAQQVSQVPITTRAVGFLSNECYKRAVTQQPRAETVCNVNQLYRVSLAQHELQIDQAERNVQGLTDSVKRPKQDTFLPDDLRQQVTSQPQTFSLIANLVNSTGNFDYQGQKFSVFVPPMKTVDVEAPAQPVETTPKRVARPRVRLVPDPYLVTLTNLREVVEALSDPRTPQNERSYFRRNNPLPGAKWNDEDLLINPNEIISPHYSRRELREDCAALKSMLGLIGSKMASLLGDCNLDGLGSVSQLVSAYKENFSLDGTVMNLPSNERFRSSRPLEDQEFISGVMHLLGEYPHEPPDITAFSLREPSIAVGFLDVDWAGMIDRCLVKH